MLKKFTIYGERCSGTNYLENIMLANFDIELTWDYGWKHFFGFQNDQLKNSDDTLFICIIRNPIEWINSFYKQKYHLPLRYTEMNEEEKIDAFLNKEFWSFNDKNGNRNVEKEIMEDRNIYTGERYKNIFELRYTKIKFMQEDLPNKIKNYIFIKYEDLLYDFKNTLNKIKDKGLKIKDEQNFPLNITMYKKDITKTFDINNKTNIIPSTFILNNPNFDKSFEKALGYYKIYVNRKFKDLHCIK